MHTDRLIIRRLNTKDIDDLVENGNDYEIHYNSFFLMKFPFGKSEAIEVINEDKKAKNMQRFGIDLNGAPVLHSCHPPESSSAGGKIIGLIDLYNINLKSRKLKLGYWIGKNYRRKGYATEAIQKMIEYSFENFDVDEIIATTLVSNESSMSLLKKLGFERGKVLKKDRFLDGEYIDSVQFVLKRRSKTNT